MQSLSTKLISLVKDLDLGDINETKKLSLLDEIGEILTQRIILRLVKEVDSNKKKLFIEKINKNKNDPNKVLLFIDYFIDDADKIIDEEIKKYKKDLQKVLKN